MKYLSYAIVVFALCEVTAYSQNPDGPEYPIKVAGEITIDGDLSDWGNAEFVTYDRNTVSETGGMDWNGTDAVCTFAMMYDNEALYISAQVEDDIHSYNLANTSEYAWWERDGVQWFIDFTSDPMQPVTLYPDFVDTYEDLSGDGTWLPGEMIIVIGATEDQADSTTRRWPVGTRSGARSDNEITLPDGSTPRGEVNDAWEVVVVLDDADYTVEGKIPFESLEKSKFFSDPEDTSQLTPEELDKLGWEPRIPEPLPGSSILFTHLCIDVDIPEGGFDTQVMWVGDGDRDANWAIATFAEMTVVDDWMLR